MAGHFSMKLLRPAFFLAAASAATLAHAQSLTDLGLLPGGTWSEGLGVSADGSIVVGRGNSTNGNRAFRWTSAGGMTDLGVLPGGNYSYAYNISGDGSVVVGSASNAIGNDRAFRWTSAGGMTDLGVLPGGIHSYAFDVSADGSVVVGEALDASFQSRAFRWTAAGGMTDLGTLGGTTSTAQGVSSDGSVVVGRARNASAENRAFRWTSAGGMTDLGTLGGNYSTAEAVSADGSVVIGHASNVSNQTRAFRWTAAGGMTDLGTLGGTGQSRAYDVSADGSVIVGYAPNASNQSRAFRWTAAGGMTDLGVLPGGTYSYAEAVSSDGSIVVGASDSTNGQRAFLYTNQVMLDVQDWLGSVGGVHSTLSTSLELCRTFMEGAHHRPLAELGRGRSYWVTGDVASSSRTRDLVTRSGEAGVTFEPAANVLLGVGGGYGRQDQDLANDGSARISGQYVLAEADFIRADGGILSVLVSAGDWDAAVDRGYVTGGGVEYSRGETDLSSKSIRVRYDTPTLFRTLETDLKAYVSYALSRSSSDAYSETGGSFPGSFGAMKQTAKEGRLGVAAVRMLGEKLRGRLSAEWIRRYDREQAAMTVTDITSTLDLTLPATPVVRDQARFGFDLDYLMDARTTLSFTVHASGRGESPDVSGALSLRRGF